jgi:hypothetical protein
MPTSMMPRTRAKRAKPKAGASLREVLAPEWCTWVADNVVRGVEAPELVRRLVAAGVKTTLARRAVREIRRSPALHAVATAQERIRQLELQLRLKQELAEPVPRAIERRKKPRAAEFFARYWAQNRPVIFTDATRGWKLWSPEDMKALLGEVRIDVTAGRDGDPDYDLNFRAHTKRTTVGAFVDRMRASGATNDFYLVANNHAMRRKGFARLLDRIVVDETYFDKALLPGGSSLWLGPAGTVTPLHHDTTNILFHQIYGRKQFLLISPHEEEVRAGARGFYAAHDPQRFGGSVMNVVLEPGEALFLPAGWWHEVRSLDVSISFSLLGFRRPNAFEWYRPGFPPPSPPSR